MRLPTIPPGVSNMAGLVEWLRKVVLSIAAGWSLEHNANGTHKFDVQTPQTFDATRFTGGGSLTWTVTNANVTTEAWGTLGDRLFWDVYVAGTSTGGSGATTLRIRMPQGYIAKRTTSRATGFLRDAGTYQAGLVETVKDSPLVSIYKADVTNFSAAASSNTGVGFSVCLEVYR